MTFQKHWHFFLEKDYWFAVGIFDVVATIFITFLTGMLWFIYRFILFLELPDVPDISFLNGFLVYLGVLGWLYICSFFAMLETIDGHLLCLHYHEAKFAFNLPQALDPKKFPGDNISNWLRDNCEDSFVISARRLAVLFKSKDDAMLFKLTWEE